MLALRSLGEAVPGERVELSSLSAHDFESCVFASFTTRAFFNGSILLKY